MTHDRLTEGDPLPDVTLLDHDDRQVHLHELADGRPLVVFFYPKDGTPVCTAEACAFRDNWDRFRQLGAAVVGVSSDTPESHRQVEHRRELPYPLLSDPDGSVRTAFGVPRTLGVFPGRYTYVADSGGVIRHVFGSQLAAGRHVQQALSALERMAEDAPSR